MQKTVYTMLLAGCLLLSLNACAHIAGAYVTSGATIAIQGRVFDAATGDPLADTAITMDVVIRERAEVSQQELARSDTNGDFSYEGTVMWCRKMGPIEFHRQPWETGILSLHLQHTGYASVSFDYPLESVWDTGPEPFPIALDKVTLTPLDLEHAQAP